MKIAVRGSEAFLLNLRTRMPFRYGIVTMTRLPHFILRVSVEIDGQLHHGVAADNLPPKWFTKDPATSFREELEDILEVIRHARQTALELGSSESPFDLWTELYAAQKSWGTGRYPPLLWNFGVTLVERALIDTFCRVRQTPFSQAVRENSLGIRLGELFPELHGIEPAELLPADPLRSITVRHTVGLTDPLTDAEIPCALRIHDGLPESLETYVRQDGITHLKIKLGGNVAGDLARLRRISDLFESGHTPCVFTLDGNENFLSVEPFIQLWESLRTDPSISNFLNGLIFVEQPFHRDVALTAQTCASLLEWKNRPPIIIDESDSEAGTLAIALEGGYSGTSHKNCKGVFKGIANAALIAHRRRIHPKTPLFMSAEDLTNVGPVALLQDLAVLSTLGINHAERNGHHYFAGLSQFPQSVQREILKKHGDLYREHPGGFPAVRIDSGQIAIDSIVRAPFGFAGEIDFEGFTPQEAWSFELLG